MKYGKRGFQRLRGRGRANENKRLLHSLLGTPQKDVCLCSHSTPPTQQTKNSQDAKGTKTLAKGRFPIRPGRTWYWEREGSSPTPLGPRRRTTRKELSSGSHRKSSPPRPKTRFLVNNWGGSGGDEGNDEAGFLVSAELWLFSPSRSRRNTAWLGSQVCHSSPSPGPPSALAILNPQLSVASPLSAANPLPASTASANHRSGTLEARDRIRGGAKVRAAHQTASSPKESQSPVKPILNQRRGKEERRKREEKVNKAKTWVEASALREV